MSNYVRIFIELFWNIFGTFGTSRGIVAHVDRRTFAHNIALSFTPVGSPSLFWEFLSVSRVFRYPWDGNLDFMCHSIFSTLGVHRIIIEGQNGTNTTCLVFVPFWLSNFNTENSRPDVSCMNTINTFMLTLTYYAHTVFTVSSCFCLWPRESSKVHGTYPFVLFWRNRKGRLRCFFSMFTPW